MEKFLFTFMTYHLVCSDHFSFHFYVLSLGLFGLCFFSLLCLIIGLVLVIIIIIMVIFSKCHFYGEHIALSLKNNNGVNIELGKTKQIKCTVHDAN